MSTSSDARPNFDPYQEWLGIAPAKRPYNHYSLLGLEAFERDRQVISNAAQRAMAELRKRRRGATARDAQRLIAEVSKATTCLLNANRQRLYDHHLRELLSPPAAAASPSVPPALPAKLPATDSASAPEIADTRIVISEKELVRPTIVAKKARRGRRQQPLGLMFGFAGVAFVVTIAGILWAFWSGPGDPVSAELSVTVAARDASADVPELDRDSPSADHSGAPQRPIENLAANAFEALETSQFEFPADLPPFNSSPPEPSADLPLPPEVPLPFSSTDDDPKSVEFAGTDRIALAESLTSLDFAQPFTLEMWVRFEKDTYAHWLIGDLVFGNAHADVPDGVTAGWQAWIMQTEGGKQRFAIATGKGFWADYPASHDSWRHLAVSGDGTTVAIFVDGRRAASQPATLLADHHVASPMPLHFGSHPHLHPTQPPGMQGLLRGLRISSTCRYEQNFSPPPSFDNDDATELVFDFRHAVSSRQISDVSRHARHGVLWGARWRAVKPLEAAIAATPVTTGSDVRMTSTVEATSTSSSGPEPDTTPTLPTSAELGEARQRVEALFAREIAAARRPTEQLALAAKFVALAGESAEDRTTQYVLFEMAIERLAQGNDLSKSLKVIDDFASHFEIDRLARRAAAIGETGTGPLNVAQRRELAETALQAGYAMVRAGRFQLAEDVAQAAVSAATRVRSQDLGRRARQLRDDARRSSHVSKEAELARQQLDLTPGDPAANLTYGKFLCLQMNQWSEGLTYLAKGDDDTLRNAAVAETNAGEVAASQAEAAELWYAARTAVDKNDVSRLLEHVLELSRTAAPGLKGIAKLSLERRMQQITAELPAQPASTTPPKPPAARFEPPLEYQALVGRLQVDGRDASILWKYRSGLRLADSNVADILLQAGVARGRVQLDFVGKLYLAETTTVNIMHQGGSPGDATAKLYVDGKLIGALGGGNATTDVYKLDLAKGEHKVAWQLVGRDLAINSVKFTDAADATPLAVYHDAQLLNAVRDTPSRARLTVNLVSGIVNQ